MHKFLLPKQALEEVTLVTILVLACESLKWNRSLLSDLSSELCSVDVNCCYLGLSSRFENQLIEGATCTHARAARTTVG